MFGLWNIILLGPAGLFLNGTCTQENNECRTQNCQDPQHKGDVILILCNSKNKEYSKFFYVFYVSQFSIGLEACDATTANLEKKKNAMIVTETWTYEHLDKIAIETEWSNKDQGEKRSWVVFPHWDCI